ncbi:sulfite exporter TauE/SafE family protein [Sulfurospirillum barnesii]|uniref:Probable membrane transporter protein n=1 Tax=Sulfurospirillum barnesii (strain ATCC 700032 / DSM 10660 / SES-3) TaxID=760154 RepID=I3XWA6_SULBS|nr:sulfite exporter TauE/SafE family protein [Sulfurospirillum barnesii]AFL68230.1 putative permease [Sulfurospirillum barnesii SES-3]
MGFEWVVAFLVLGCVVGFMAGLLGIGGGGIMVPVLTSIFLAQGIPVEHVVHMALGTSMASIVVTSFASMRAHHKKGAVLWGVVKYMAGGVIIGTFLATFLASSLKSAHLAIFFALFMAYVSIQMAIDKKPKPTRELSTPASLFGAGSFIGMISALVSIGGGSLTVPYLIWQNVDVKKAIATSAAIGFPLSIAGTLGYIVNGVLHASNGQSMMLGFVYLPAVILISMPSYFIAPLGAKMAHSLPVSKLKKIFAVLLMVLSLKMLTSVL